MTMLASALALLAAATISSPKIGTFFTRPGWMPDAVASSNTVGSSDTYSPWVERGTNGEVTASHFFRNRRIGADETAAVYALIESMMERQYCACAGDEPCADPRFGPTDERAFRFDIYAATNSSPEPFPPPRVYRHLSPFDSSNTNRTACLRFAEGYNLMQLRKSFLAWRDNGFGPLYEAGDTMRPGWSAGARFATAAPVTIVYDGTEVLRGTFFRIGGFGWTYLASSYGSQGGPCDWLSSDPGYLLAACLDCNAPQHSLAQILFNGTGPVAEPEPFTRLASGVDPYDRIDVIPPKLPAAFDQVCMYAESTVPLSDADVWTPNVPRFGVGATGEVLNVSCADGIGSPVRRLWSDEIAAMNQRVSMLDMAVDAIEPPRGTPSRVIVGITGLGSAFTAGNAVIGSYGDISLPEGYEVSISTTNVAYRVTDTNANPNARAHVTLYRETPEAKFEGSTDVSGTAELGIFADESDIEEALGEVGHWPDEGERFYIEFADVDLIFAFRDFDGLHAPAFVAYSDDSGHFAAGSMYVDMVEQDVSLTISYDIHIDRRSMVDMTTSFRSGVGDFPGRLAKELGVVKDDGVAHYALESLCSEYRTEYLPFPVYGPDPRYGFVTCRTNNLVDIYWQLFASTGGMTRAAFVEDRRREAFARLEREHSDIFGCGWDDVAGLTTDPAEEAGGILESLDAGHSFWPDRIPVGFLPGRAMERTWFDCVYTNGQVKVFDQGYETGERAIVGTDPKLVKFDYADEYPATPYYGDAMMRVGTAAKFDFNTLRRKDGE